MDLVKCDLTDGCFALLPQPSTSSSGGSRKRQNRKSVWSFAKRVVRSTRNRLSLYDGWPASFCDRATRVHREPSPPAHQLVAPVLLSVFENLRVSERIRLRQVCHLTDFLCSSIPISLPPLKLQSVSSEEIYLVTEHVDLVINHLVPDLFFNRNARDDGAIALNGAQAELILRRVACRVDHIEHLWLETNNNGSLCSSLLKALLPDSESTAIPRRRKITMERLTVVGCKMYEINQTSSMLSYFCNSLVQLRLRHVRMESASLSKQLWSRIAMCRRLKQFQYETCCFDKYSHEFVAGALCDKQIVTLELGGLHMLSVSQLGKLTELHCVKHLSVLCTRIGPASYLEDHMIQTLQQLSTLLIQCDSSYALDDLEHRLTAEKLLDSLSSDASLEVVHEVGNRVAHAARVMSYWLELSRDTNRAVMLKLSGISQDRMDQAIGRLVRKCDNVFKAPSEGNFLLLTRGLGRIRVLDRYTWFGENEED